ncbi:MAG: DEAD/DEAH box helicase [bacterium]
MQQQCLQNSLAGVDILCQAKSGMGKTAVFVLTILNRLVKTDPECSALIISHTRELAIQIKDEFQRFSTNLEGINTMVIYGGENIQDQITQLKEKKPKIIVGTPGRILALIKKGMLPAANVSIFVLDECDKILQQLGKFLITKNINLDMRGDVQFIFKATPQKKQVMFFSATMPKDIREVARKFMNKVRIIPIFQLLP